jgi:hypothetical protein
MKRVPPKLAAAYRKTFGSPEGKTVLADLLITCCVLDPAGGTEPGQPVDPNRIVLNEGARNVGLRVLKLLGVKPHEIVTKAREIEDEYSKTMEGFLQ